MILLVDGTNLVHRAYYALKSSPGGLQVTVDKTPIGATSTVLRSLLAAIRTHSATHLAVCFDNGYPTFRHELYPGYKGDRNEKDSALVEELALTERLCRCAGMAVTPPAGWEADDAIATLATNASRALLYSGDRDLFALADEHISILYPGSSTAAKVVLTADDVRTKMKVWPRQVADYKALCGDKSDRIPGVKGIGDTIATDLLARFDNVEDIYEKISSITGRPFTLLKPAQAEAMLSKQLALLVRDVPLGVTIEQFALAKLDFWAIAKELNSLGLNKLAAEFCQKPAG